MVQGRPVQQQQLQFVMPEAGAARQQQAEKPQQQQAEPTEEADDYDGPVDWKGDPMTINPGALPALALGFLAMLPSLVLQMIFPPVHIRHRRPHAVLLAGDRMDVALARVQTADLSGGDGGALVHDIPLYALKVGIFQTGVYRAAPTRQHFIMEDYSTGVVMPAWSSRGPQAAHAHANLRPFILNRVSPRRLRSLERFTNSNGRGELLAVCSRLHPSVVRQDPL